MQEKGSALFEDERVQRLSDLWLSRERTAKTEQKDRVGLAYISKALGLGGEIASLFVEKDSDAYHAVGMAQAGMRDGSDLFAFWQEVKEIFPNTFTDQDIELLASEGGIEGVFHFLWQLSYYPHRKSLVLHDLAVNAHVYK